MIKFLATVLVAFQKICDAFSDDEAFDPTWMDADRWQLTRL